MYAALRYKDRVIAEDVLKVDMKQTAVYRQHQIVQMPVETDAINAVLRRY